MIDSNYILINGIILIKKQLMKIVFLAFIMALALDTCQSDSISPNKLVGVWNPAYQMQNKNPDGTWGKWSTINTFAALPSMEFTIDGKFLQDGKPGADCCSAGNKYTVAENIIKFSDFKDCPQVRCMDCRNWTILELDSDTLVIEVCDSRSKYTRNK